MALTRCSSFGIREETALLPTSLHTCGYLTSVATTGDGLGSWVSNFVGRAGCGLKWPTGQLLRAEGAAGGGSRVGRRWSGLGTCGQVDLGLLLARCQGLVDRAREPSHPLLIMRRV